MSWSRIYLTQFEIKRYDTTRFYYTAAHFDLNGVVKTFTTSTSSSAPPLASIPVCFDVCIDTFLSMNVLSGGVNALGPLVWTRGSAVLLVAVASFPRRLGHAAQKWRRWLLTETKSAPLRSCTQKVVPQQCFTIVSVIELATIEAGIVTLIKLTSSIKARTGTSRDTTQIDR